MLKRFIGLLVVLIIVAGAAYGMIACDDTGDDNPIDTPPERPAADNIYSDNGYVDYASEVIYDTEKFPDLASHGLFWTKWNESTEQMDTFRADTEEGAALVDPSKPTLIMVHGMLGEAKGSSNQERFYLNRDIATPSEFGLTTSDVSLGRLWQLEGWNVAYFHYNSFTSEGANFHIVESKIWATNGPQGMGFRNSEGELEQASEYTVSEHFAADYIRAMKLLPDTMGDQEIRIAVHSMGGVVGTTGVFLLTELAEHGQLPEKQLPNRLALLDPFFGVKIELNGKVVLSSFTNLIIRWSGKPLYQESTGASMLECVKAMTHKGIAVEFYGYKQSWVMGIITPAIKAGLQQYATYVIVSPDWKSYSSKYSITFNGHNGVRDWYFCSIVAPPVLDVSEGVEEGAFAASASTPTEYLREKLAGVTFTIAEGAETIPADDDLFIREN
ncbi:MAG: hypothetical protein WC292_00970 [Clostridia bacterium]